MSNDEKQPATGTPVMAQPLTKTKKPDEAKLKQLKESAVQDIKRCTTYEGLADIVKSLSAEIRKERIKTSPQVFFVACRLGGDFVDGDVAWWYSTEQTKHAEEWFATEGTHLLNSECASLYGQMSKVEFDELDFPRLRIASNLTVTRVEKLMSLEQIKVALKRTGHRGFCDGELAVFLDVS